MEASAIIVDTAFYAIQRRYQLENLNSFDKKDWPRTTDLIDYRSKEPRDFDYYRPTDYFLPLGEWLHDASARRKRLAEQQAEEAKHKK
jgi:hypothetical protein